MLFRNVPGVYAQQLHRHGLSGDEFRRELVHDSIMSAFSKRFIVLDSLLNRVTAVADGTPGFFSFTADTLLDSAFLAKRIHEQRAFKRKSGLELTGQAYQRLDNTLGFDEDNDQYSRYNTKFQGEIGWNFFNSSFYQRKTELKLISQTNRQEYLQAQKQRMLSVWDERKEQIEQKYDRLTAAVLYEQLQNAELLHRAYRFVYEKERSSNEKLLDVMNEEMRLEYALVQAGGSESLSGAVAGGEIAVVRPVFLKVDTTRLPEAIRTRNPDLQLSLVREQMIASRIRLTNYGQGMRLTPFVRASHYLRSTLPSSTNVEAGARFTFPLYDDTSAKRKALRTEEVIESLQRNQLYEDVWASCRRILSQLDRLNAAIAAEYRYEQNLRRFIALRKEAYLNSRNGYNHIARLEEYNEYLKSLERTYGLLRLRSLCLLDLQKASGCPNLAVFITEEEVKE